MNLQTQIRQVRARLSQPARDDPGDDRITDQEIVDWIHKAEIRVTQDLIEREKMVTTATFPARNAVELYDHGIIDSDTTDGVAGDKFTIEGTTALSTVDDLYNGMTVIITSGDEITEERIITDYAATGNTITVGVEFDVAIQGSVTFEIRDKRFPIDILDIVSVDYAGTECVRHPVHDLVALDDNDIYLPLKGFQQYFYTIAGGEGTTRLGIRPIPDGVENIKITYVKVPLRRHKHHSGRTTSVGTTKTLVDTSLTNSDDYWNGTQLRMTSGVDSGTDKTIVDFDNGSTTLFVPEFGDVTSAAIDYEMGQVSEIPQEYNDLVIAWASYIGLIKDKELQEAQSIRGEYEAYVQTINTRYGFGRTEPDRTSADERAL